MKSRGIVVDGNEIKLVIFADDMTSFVRDKLSYRTLFDTLTLFSTYSGLKVNHEKRKFFYSEIWKLVAQN